MYLFRVYGENSSQTMIFHAENQEIAKQLWHESYKNWDEIPPITAVDVIPPPYARLMERDQDGTVHCLAKLSKDAAEGSADLIKDREPNRDVWAEEF